ncbi:MAG: FMN-binding negative transcriptional regulator [Myxococcaceae bacterium]|nr:FMN-binding negative transcriptional regulator [Myxococcaceae bacterium]
MSPTNPGGQKLYVPAPFAPADRSIGWQVISEYPFGLLLLPDGSMTPLPFLGDERTSLLRGHLARANSASSVPDGSEATVAFMGPHAYVSPTWYRSPREHAPTWNYIFVRVTGTLRWLTTTQTRQVLDDLCRKFEETDGYSPGWVDDEKMARMLEEIVGFEIRVSDVQPKLKLSQNRTSEDWARVKDRFAASPPPGPDLARWMVQTRNPEGR